MTVTMSIEVIENDQLKAERDSVASMEVRVSFQDSFVAVQEVKLSSQPCRLLGDRSFSTNMLARHSFAARQCRCAQANNALMVVRMCMEDVARRSFLTWRTIVDQHVYFSLCHHLTVDSHRSSHMHVTCWYWWSYSLAEVPSLSHQFVRVEQRSHLSSRSCDTLTVRAHRAAETQK